MDTQKTDTKCVSWFITVNTPSDAETEVTERLSEWGLLEITRYYKAAIEEGGDTANRHMHIYLHLTTQQRFSALKKIWPRAKIQEPIGTPQQQIDYIGNPDFVYSDKHSTIDKRGKPKGGTCEKVWEYGTTDGIRLNQHVKNTGSSLDFRLLRAKERIDAGDSLESLYDTDFPLMVRYGNRLAEYFTLKKGVSVAEKIEQRKREEAEKIENDRIEALNILNSLPNNDSLEALIEAELSAKQVTISYAQ